MTQPLSTRYDPTTVEPDLYRWWAERGDFRARTNRADQSYVIMMPAAQRDRPLHMGHALNNTIQDVLVRSQRMQGVDALWLPGTDHAGSPPRTWWSASSGKEGKTRARPGREAFVERSGPGRTSTARASSSSSRRWAPRATGSATRFTLDRGLSRAVREAFVRLYEKGLIYRGELHHQLVPALPHRALRTRRSSTGPRRQALVRSATRSASAGHVDGGDHPARDDAGRHRRGRAPGRRALRRPGRAHVIAAAPGRRSRSSRTSSSIPSSAPARSRSRRRTTRTTSRSGQRHDSTIDVMTPTATMTTRSRALPGLDRVRRARKRGGRSSRHSGCWRRSSHSTPSATATAATPSWSPGSRLSGS